MAQDRALVPCDVFMVEPVAADVDDGGEGRFDAQTRWGDAREPRRLTGLVQISTDGVRRRLLSCETEIRERGHVCVCVRGLGDDQEHWD